jgi:septal ring factor EnvC (AmiA/AmiB activator)
MVWIGFLWMFAALVAGAQDKPAQDKPTGDKPVGLFPSLQQNVEKRTAEWDTLANNLEIRIGRLLPCDPRVRAGVEEVSRASEARIVALTEYWLAVSAASKTQTEAVKRLLAQEDASAAERKTDQAEAEQERVAVNAQLTDLGESVPRLPSLAAAQKALDGLVQSSAQAAAQAAERGQSAERLSQELRDLLAAAQARQTAIDNAMKALAAEGLRWSGYYLSRQARAQTECVITNPSGAAPAAPRTPAQGKKK